MLTHVTISFESLFFFHSVPLVQRYKKLLLNRACFLEKKVNFSLYNNKMRVVKLFKTWWTKRYYYFKKIISFFMNVKLWVLVATFFSINFKLRRCFQKMDLYVIALLALLFSSKKNWKLKTFLITFTSKSFEMCTLLYTKWMNEFSFKKENEVTKRMKT